MKLAMATFAGEGGDANVADDAPITLNLSNRV
jgi:hypothetical protein